MLRLIAFRSDSRLRYGTFQSQSWRHAIVGPKKCGIRLGVLLPFCLAAFVIVASNASADDDEGKPRPDAERSERERRPSGPPPEVRERMLKQMEQMRRDGTPPSEMGERMMEFLRSERSRSDRDKQEHRSSPPERCEHPQWGRPSDEEVRNAMQVLMRHRFHNAIDKKPPGPHSFSSPFGPPWAKHHAFRGDHDGHPKHAHRFHQAEGKRKSDGKFEGKKKGKKKGKKRCGRKHRRKNR
ncbi:MAG: hypothetical protein R3C05_06045 [Pirellulaceae bacterium]